MLCQRSRGRWAVKGTGDAQMASGTFWIQPKAVPWTDGLFRTLSVSRVHFIAITEMEAEERSKQIWWFLWVCAAWFHFPVSPKAFLLSLCTALHLPPLSTRHVPDLQAPSVARELGQRFPFIPPKPERTLDYFSCETAPFSIDSLCWRDLHPCRSWASPSPGGSSPSQDFGAPSADSGLLGPNKRVEKGLSRGWEGSSPPHETFILQ